MKDRFNRPAQPPSEPDKLQEFKDFSDEQMAKHGAHHAVLSESGEVMLVSLFEWAFWLEKGGGQRVIKQDYVAKHKVSTVFVGLDLGWNPKRPLWFETMVFGPEEETDFFGKKMMMRPSLWTQKCTTLAQAKEQHKEGRKWLAGYLRILLKKSAP